MDSSAGLIWAMLFGAIGMGYFVYGRKQRAIMPYISGVSLFLFPYFVANVYLMVAVGVAIMLLPYFIDY